MSEYALYQGVTVCEVLQRNKYAALVRFDNDEVAVVMNNNLQYHFDLNEGNVEYDD